MERHWWWPFGKPNQEPEQIKCADCGFLSVISRDNGMYIEADRAYRLEGEEGFGGMEGKGVFCEPHCSIHYQSIHTEPLSADGGSVKLVETGGGIISLKNEQGEDVMGKAVVANITKLRFCDGFFLWRPGFSPKEHCEMLDRQRWQEWQEAQRKEDKHWRIIELIVIAIVTVILAGVFTIIGSFIERGSLFP